MNILEFRNTLIRVSYGMYAIYTQRTYIARWKRTRCANPQVKYASGSIEGNKISDRSSNMYLC